MYHYQIEITGHVVQPFVIIPPFVCPNGPLSKEDYFYCTLKGATDRKCVELRVKSIWRDCISHDCVIVPLGLFYVSINNVRFCKIDFG